MAKYDIPVIITVEADNIDAAREIVYGEIEKWENTIAIPGNGTIAMANDSLTIAGRRRVVILHPENTHAEYDQEAYEAALKEDEE
jgi:hypothetical protein